MKAFARNFLVISIILSFFGTPALAEDVAPVPVDVAFAFDLLNPGEFGMVIVTGWDVVSATGTFDNRPVSFQRDGESLVALIAASLGIDRSHQYLDVAVTLNSGEVVEYRLPVPIGWDQYGRQTVVLPSNLGYLADPDIQTNEDALLLQVYGQNTPQRFWDGPLVPPIDGTMLSPFGALRTYSGSALIGRHTGYDIYAITGTQVKASAPGRVVLAQELDIHGKMVIVDHGWGVFTGYCHLSEFEVEVGQIVDTGDTVGLSGNTGRSAGPHLHWELAVGGTWVNPVTWEMPTLPNGGGILATATVGIGG